jgi:serine/threonine protein phosphatase PrpC
VITALITEVKAKGAPDNITIVWAQVTDKMISSEIKKIGAANE